MYKTIIINLDKDKDRLENVTNELYKSSIPFERISGVYGKNLSKKEIQDNTTLFCSKFCTSGMIGCAMSHKKVLEKITSDKESDTNAKFLILEDDIILHKEFNNKLETILDNVPKDFDILYLGYFLSNYNDNYTPFIKFCHLVLGCFSKKQKKINDHIFIPKCPLATHGYMVTKRGAQKLLDMINEKKIYYHIDVMFKNYFLECGNNINVYASNPILIRQRSFIPSNIIEQKYPLLIFNYFDKFKTEWDLSYGQILFSPSHIILGTPISAINIIIVLFFLTISFYFGKSGDNYLVQQVTIVFVLYNLLELKQAKEKGQEIFWDILKMYMIIMTCLVLPKKLKSFLVLNKQ
jgi:glycosyl transferase family 25